MPTSPSRAVELLSCVFVVPAIVLAILWLPLAVAGLGPTADFMQFYSAGKIVLQGNAPQLYQLARDSEVLRQFTHPPFEALLYAPFAALPYDWAFRLWTYFSLVCLGGVFFLLRPRGPAFELPERLLLLAASFFPVFAAILQGQDSLLALLAVTGVFAALENGRKLTAGALLGLALIKPQLALPLAILLLRRGGGRLAAGFCVAGGALAAISILVFGPRVLVEFPATLLHMNQNGNASAFHLIPEAMINLRGGAALLLAGVLRPAVLAGIVAGLSALLFGWTLARSAGAPPERWSTLILLVTLLVSFHLLIHDLSVIVLPIFFFLADLQAKWPKWNREKVLCAAPVGLLPLTILCVQAAGSKKFAFALIPVLLLAAAIFKFYSRELLSASRSAEPA
jgi:hypothetical protein